MSNHRILAGLIVLLLAGCYFPTNPGEAPLWNPIVVYKDAELVKASFVSSDGTIGSATYMSIQANNFGHYPPVDSAWWTKTRR